MTYGHTYTYARGTWGLTMSVIPPGVILLWIVLFSTLRCVSRHKKYLQVHLPVSIIVTLTFAHPVVTKAAATGTLDVIGLSNVILTNNAAMHIQVRVGGVLVTPPRLAIGNNMDFVVNGHLGGANSSGNYIL